MSHRWRQIISCVCICLCFCIVAKTQTPVLRDSVISPAIIQMADSIVNSTKDSSLLLIGDITIHGNRKTKPYIIEREIAFKQGEYIKGTDLQKKLELTQQQVMNTSLFTSVVVYVESIKGDMLFINIDVKERLYLLPLPYFKLIDRNFNQWWVEQKASIDRVNYGLKFQYNNVTGRNDRMAINLIAGYSRQILLKYEQPFADRKLKHGYSVSFNFSRQRELNYGTSLSKQVFYKQDNFVLQNTRAEIAYLYRPAVRTRHAVRFAYVSGAVSDTVLEQNPNFYPGQGLAKISYPELSYTIQHFNMDYNAYPTKGVYAEATIMRRGFGGRVNLTQLSVQGSYTFPVATKLFMHLQGAGIIKVPFHQPFINQQVFGYGGPFFRGLEYYVFDGAAGVMARATLRKQIFSMVLKSPENMKRSVSIPMRFFLKVGADIGYTYHPNPGNSLLNNKFIRTQTIGLDWVLPQYDIVLKFEYSFNQLGQSGFFFHTRSDF